MTPDLYSIDEVASRLGLHVRTVRNYVRSGRLKAVRIGKQYRVAREDLDTLTGETRSRTEPGSNPPPQDEASSIAEVDGVSADLASRLTTSLLAAAKGRQDLHDPLRIDTIYDPDRHRLKVILIGRIKTTATLLTFISVYMESMR